MRSCGRFEFDSPRSSQMGDTGANHLLDSGIPVLLCSCISGTLPVRVGVFNPNGVGLVKQLRGEGVSGSTVGPPHEEHDDAHDNQAKHNDEPRVVEIKRFVQRIIEQALNGTPNPFKERHV